VNCLGSPAVNPEPLNLPCCLFSEQQVRVSVTGEAGLVFPAYFPAMGQTVTILAKNRLRRMQALMTVCTAQCAVIGGCMLQIFNDIIMAWVAE
jgi:hypothetical protein